MPPKRAPFPPRRPTEDQTRGYLINVNAFQENGFNEKAGRSQVNSGCSFVKQSFFSRRVATVAMLPSALSRSDFISLGACWAFSFQPVLPSVCRPVVRLFPSRTWARPLTQSPKLGFGFCRFSSWNGFDFCSVFRFTRLPPLSFGCYCAMVRTLLRSPTGDAAAPRAFLRWRRSLASSRSSRRVRPAFNHPPSTYTRLHTMAN